MYAFIVYHPILLCELFYRLGHGDLIEEEGKSIPFRVEILHMHRYHTVSLSPLDWINYCGTICHIFNILHLLMMISCGATLSKTSYAKYFILHGAI